MTSKDLIAGYATYTDTRSLAIEIPDDAPGITPTTASSALCVATIAASVEASVDNTIDHGC